MAYLPPNLVFSIVCILYPSSVFDLCLVSWGFDPECFPPRIGLFVNVDWPAIFVWDVKTSPLTPQRFVKSQICEIPGKLFSLQLVPGQISSRVQLQNITKQNIPKHFCPVVESWYELLKVWPKCLINYMYKCEAWSCSVWRVGGNMIRKCNSGLTNLFETCHKM